ncbi:MAG: hypothetical protein KDJ52_05130 [Anaerolineae bacterium]|nr:hypothetical protein [Anaerolineae bacterium]
MPETPEETTNHELPTPTEEKPIESITITSDVIIPDYKPLNVPYSQWETERSQELLTANGFGTTPDEWRQATQHSSGLIRSAAYYLLTRHPEQQDEDLFRRGLEDSDQTSQNLAIYGLYRLGDSSAVPTLEKTAQLDVDAHTAATQAAGLLAEMGKPMAFATIQQAMNSNLEYIRLFAIQNAMSFVPLHGQIYAADKTIDIWDLYRQALQDENIQVRSVANLQLQELDFPEAQALLQNYSKTSE